MTSSTNELEELERERKRAREWSHDRRDTLRFTLCFALALFCMLRIQSASAPLNITQYYIDVETGNPDAQYKPEPYVFWIDLNEATSADLKLLPRIGPTLAGRIIEYREENGDFNEVSDLLNVRGIGVKTLDVIAPYLRVQATEYSDSNSD
ncbi:MAG: helix-hairpin-helix domain-containing protein [Planctomycetia bacterium]|nr:helix-hairpin-helix domain-containing protein [Planctomycetia bacterium]